MVFEFESFHSRKCISICCLWNIWCLHAWPVTYFVLNYQIIRRRLVISKAWLIYMHQPFCRYMYNLPEKCNVDSSNKWKFWKKKKKTTDPYLRTAYPTHCGMGAVLTYFISLFRWHRRGHKSALISALQLNTQASLLHKWQQTPYIKDSGWWNSLYIENVYFSFKFSIS